MKNSKVCSKCGSKAIYVSEGGAGAYGSGNNIPIGSFVWQSVPVDRYICCDCGYTEEWLRREHLDKIANAKRRV
ncbi:MAG: hypothetical protein J6P98_04580 [Clostridia bacterium]|nr:hypothetical protein [Clostridia bacterium]